MDSITLDGKILNFFKKCKQGFVSGEELSEKFGISRSAVWKHIEKLRSHGYEIIASPHLGYQLVSTPDCLNEVELGWQLNTEIIGCRVYSYQEVGSTNDVAYGLAVAGAPEGTVIVAEYQTEGRGRLGRRWVSPKGKGAYFSVILRPAILPRELSAITLWSSLSIARTIREIVDLPAFIRWPNDILVRRRKVCGILVEMNAELDKINFVILGIGININTRTELLPEGASSLAEEKGENISRVQFVKDVIRGLDRYYRIFNKGKINVILEEYKQLSAVLDRRVQVNYHNRVISGQAIDVDKEGALILRLDSGFNERVLAGDIIMLR